MTGGTKFMFPMHSPVGAYHPDTIRFNCLCIIIISERAINSPVARHFESADFSGGKLTAVVHRQWISDGAW